MRNRQAGVNVGYTGDKGMVFLIAGAVVAHQFRKEVLSHRILRCDVAANSVLHGQTCV